MGNICCSQKEEWLIEQSRHEEVPQSRPMAKMCIAPVYESDSEQEEEQELKIILTTERRFSDHSQDSLKSHSSKKLRFESDACPVNQFDALLERSSNEDVVNQPLDAPLFVVSKDELTEQPLEVEPQPLEGNDMQIATEEVH